MAPPYSDEGIDEYLRKRLMPVEGAIPHLSGIEMYGNSVPAGTVASDLFVGNTRPDEAHHSATAHQAGFTLEDLLNGENLAKPTGQDRPVLQNT